MSGDLERSISGPVRRIAALGLLVATVAALWGGVARPVVAWTHARIESLHDARFALRRAQQVAAADAQLSEQRLVAGERELQPRVLEGASEAQAAAQVQVIVERLARSEGLVVESMQNLPSASRLAGPLQLVMTDLRASGTERAIVRALAAIERSRPALRVEHVQIRSNDGLAMPMAATASPRLSLELKVSGAWLAPIPATAPSRGQESSK